MVILITVCTTLFYLIWYLVCRKFNKKFFRDNHRLNSEAYIQVIVLLIFASFLTYSFFAYCSYAETRADDFLVSSGLLFSLLLAVLGIIINFVYKCTVKAFNRRYKKKYNEEHDLFDLQTPISIYFDMGIILAGTIAYTEGEYELLGLCTSLLIGEYLGLYTLIKKRDKDKEDTLFSKLRRVPIITYLLFICMIVFILLEITFDNIIAFFIGLVIAVVIILYMELKSYRQGKYSDFYDGEVGSGISGPVNPTKQENISVESQLDSTVKIFRSANEIRILKNDDVCQPIHDISEINEFIRKMGIFTSPKGWYIPGTDKFAKKFAQAKENYAHSAQENEVILINDDTFSGNSKHGLLLTPTKLYQSHAFDRDFVCDLEHIKRIFTEKKPYSPGLYSIFIYADGVDREILTSFKSDLPETVDAIFKIIAFIYGYEEQ